METLYLELHPASGGQDARQFAQMLARAYLRAARDCGWSAEMVEDEGSLTLRFRGQHLAGLRQEGGGHRLIREMKGKRHTSMVGVAVLPVLAQVSNFRPQDLRIEKMRSSGHGGQNVNKRETAVRLTHLPTGLTAYIADERSQAQNHAAALELITARVVALAQMQSQDRQNQQRTAQLGAGNFAEKRRTYTVRENLVTDHRSGQTALYDRVMAGGLSLFFLSGLEEISES
jgi:peptide chain release factor 1